MYRVVRRAVEIGSLCSCVIILREQRLVIVKTNVAVYYTVSVLCFMEHVGRSTAELIVVLLLQVCTVNIIISVGVRSVIRCWQLREL